MQTLTNYYIIFIIKFGFIYLAYIHIRIYVCTYICESLWGVVTPLRQLNFELVIAIATVWSRNGMGGFVGNWNVMCRKI